jgi:hypothetical protein
MPTIELTDDELRDSAQALRIATRQAQRDADAQQNPRVQQLFIDGARRYAALSERFETAREERTKTRAPE